MKFTAYLSILLSITYGSLASNQHSIQDVYSLLQTDVDSAYSAVNRILADEDLSHRNRYQAYFIRGYIKKLNANLKGALWDYLECQRFLSLSKDKNGIYRSRLYNNIARIYETLSSFELAIKYYKLALDVAQVQDLKNIYYNIGNTLEIQGKRVEAIKNYRLALEHSEDDINQQAKINSMIAVANYNSGNYQTASNFLFKVINKIGIIDTIHVARAYHRLGTNYTLMGDTAKAIGSFKNALSLKKGKDRFKTLLDLAEVSLKTTNYEIAIQYCDEAEKYMHQFENEAFASNIYQYRGEAYFKLNKLDQYKKQMDTYVTFNNQLNALIKETSEKGEREIIATITRMHEEAVVKKAQQKRNLWFIGTASFLLLLCCWLAYREYRNQIKKRQISVELKKLNQNYSLRL